MPWRLPRECALTLLLCLKRLGLPDLIALKLPENVEMKDLYDTNCECGEDHAVTRCVMCQNCMCSGCVWNAHECEECDRRGCDQCVEWRDLGTEDKRLCEQCYDNQR